MFSEFLVVAASYFVAVNTSQISDGFVTCGSVLKLKNNEEGVRLHSHDVKYGSGSGQQSVTAVQDGDDVNSHWQILAPMEGTCKRGEPVKCGSKIRLKHLTTNCHLHSHLFAAPLTKENQEVSCFGSDESDSGDNWVVVCSSDAWLRKDAVKLKHEDTDKFLAISGKQYGRPISGQYEVVAISTSKNAALWKTAEGIFMVGSDTP
uniref:MIR domain-containing protein n=1 Tax=Elaeophora elaphi TaxID=1147741 RepID=A0A0R3RR38_9BILA